MHRTDDDPRLTAASIATNILSGLCLMAEEQDIACEHWFTGLRLGRAQVDDASVRVSYRQASQVLHRALRDPPGPDTRPRLGPPQPIRNFGPLGIALMTATTLGAGAAVGLQYSPVHGRLIGLALARSVQDNGKTG